MSRTQKRWDCDQGYGDAFIDLAVSDFASVGTDAPTLTRNAKGDISLHQIASKSSVLVVALSSILFRTGLLDDLQEMFGTGGNQPGLSATNIFGTGTGLTGARGQASGYPYTKTTGTITASAGNVSIPVVDSNVFVVGNYIIIDVGSSTLAEIQQIKSIPDSTHIQVYQLKNTHTGAGITISTHPYTTPAGITGPPSGNASASQLVPVTAPRLKGISFIDLSLRYKVSTANLTSITVGLSKTVYANATALAITDVLAPAQNGLSLVAAATPYSYRIALPSGYQVTDNAEFWLEIATVTPASSILDFYGAEIHLLYNYN